MNLLFKFQRRLHSRSAISLVEVLTSITVAVIGVAGVLVLIPFATRQANVGLDLETATIMAENSYTRFQIEGYSRVTPFEFVQPILPSGPNIPRTEEVLPWVIPRQPNVGRVLGNVNQRGEELADFPLLPKSDPRSLFFIDPLWLNVHLNNTLPDTAATAIDQNDYFFSMFRYNGVDLPPQDFAFSPGVVFGEGIFLNGDTTTAPIIPPFLPTYAHLIDTAQPLSRDLEGLGPGSQPNFMDDDMDEITDEFLPNQMTQPIAIRLFINNDELQFTTETAQDGTPIDDLSPPQPLYDQFPTFLTNGADDDGDGIIDEFDETILRRQNSDSVSWAAIAVARRPPGADLISGIGLEIDGFDFHVLVFKDRSFADPLGYDPTVAGNTLFNANLPDDEDPAFLYAPLIFPIPAALAAGTAAEPIVVRANGDAIQLSADGINIQNDEWVMLINYDRFGIAQVGFFRTIGSINARAGEPPKLLVDGPEFTLYDEFEDPGTPGSFLPNRTATYAVYLRDVINVYKRQLTPDSFE